MRKCYIPNFEIRLEFKSIYANRIVSTIQRSIIIIIINIIIKIAERGLKICEKYAKWKRINSALDRKSRATTIEHRDE